MHLIDKIAKVYETATNHYRYPFSMIGRTIDNLSDPHESNILVFAAHPDDESLGLGTVLYRHRKQGDIVSVVFTTNGHGGTGWTTPAIASKAIAKLRYQEACDALSVIGVSPKDIHCLGFPDFGLYRYTTECLNDVENLIRTIKPRQIYVHGLDGGHIDHDVTNMIVRSVCSQQAFFNVYEWAEYNAYGRAEDQSFMFPQELEALLILPTAEERDIKNSMLAKYVSQRQVLERYSHKYETIRKASLHSLSPVKPLYGTSLHKRALLATDHLHRSFVDY